MRKLMVPALTVAGFLLPLNLALGASGARNGADDKPTTDGAAWYIGKRPVRYCYQTAPDFAPQSIDVPLLLKAATNIWRDYITRKQLSVIFWSGAPSLDYEPMAECDGSQDLTLYFGVRDKTVDAYLTPDFKPLAFSQMLTYNFSAKRGTGFIWIAPNDSLTLGNNLSARYPNWQIPNTLLATLVHELGHTMGLPHIPGTIMTADLPTEIYDASLPDADTRHLAVVDHSRELMNCATGCASRPFTDARSASDVATRRNLERLVGRSLQNPVTMTVTKNGEDESGHLRLTWFIQDALGTLTVPITADDANYGPAYEMFKVAISPESAAYSEAPPSAYLGSASFHSVQVPLLITENLGLGIEDISNPLKRVSLFYGFLKDEDFHRDTLERQ